MPFVVIIIALVLLVTAYKNTQGDLLAALETDVPSFAKWFGALALTGAIGYVPGMQTISRWLLGLVMVVLVVRNYSAIFSGFQNAFSGASTSTASASVTSPAAAYASNPSSPTITTAEVSGTGSGTAGSTSTGAVTSNVASNPYDPNAYLSNFLKSAGVSAIVDGAMMGFGGIA